MEKSTNQSNAKILKISADELAKAVAEQSEGTVKIDRTTAWRWINGRNTRTNNELNEAFNEILQKRRAALGA